MGRINDGVLKAWLDGQTVFANEYKQEREILKVAINDNFERILDRYTKQEIQDFLDDLRGPGYDGETVSGLKQRVEVAEDNAQLALDTAQALELQVEDLGYIAPYSTESAYVKGNIVQLNGSSYIALQESTGEIPEPDDSNEFWRLLARKGADGTGNLIVHRDTFTATEGQTAFDLSNTYDQFQNRTTVIVGGVVQVAPENYTETTSSRITLAEPVEAGTIVEVKYFSESLPIPGDVGTTLSGHTDLLNTHTGQISEVTDQLTQKATKGNIAVSEINKNLGKLDQTYMSDEFLQQIAGDTPINAVPADNTITPVKTTFVIPSTNLFNPNEVTAGKAILIDGSIADNASYSYTNFIKVLPGQSISAYGFNQVARYDENFNFIARADISPTGGTMALPSTVHYVRLNFQHTVTTYESERRVNQGSTLLPFQSYGSSLKDVGVDSDSLKNNIVENRHLKVNSISATNLQDDSVSINKTDFLSVSTNLYNHKTDTERKAIGSSGSITDNNTYNISDFIQVDANQQYYFYGFLHASEYDADKIFIKRNLLEYAGSGLTLTPTTKYIRTNYQPNNANKPRQINKGSVMLPYEEFGVEAVGTPKLEMLNGIYEKLTKDRFILDHNILDTFVTNETYDDQTGLSSVTAETINTLFLDLVSEYPDYVSIVESSADALANPIHLLKFSADKPVATVNTKRPVVFITCGVHGHEHAPPMVTYLMLKQMIEKWQDYKHLEVMRYDVDFLVIPVVNPSGWDAFTRVNHNGVDINRNFPFNWVQGASGSTTWGGNAPASELETQFVMSVFDDYEIDIMYDFHNYHTESNGDYFLWIATHADNPYMEHLAQSWIRKMTNVWNQRYSFIPDDFWVGYSSAWREGMIQSYAYSKGIKYSATFEICWKWVLDSTSVSYDQQTITSGVEAITNLLSISLMELTRD